ncbi:hypothetical protein CAPTEDRAFT_169938 [Capitella teleta]|uniref:Tetraspanin n=1 Tax=Capitella teleta TaxID=283909 RepID=R7UUE6_CAPTE|nr:hypothetical protein CAPTEDRAFT_169938 [Capitella teleta]|eukprot:ELU09793.1 hypothetical protein CAPTEDRAFT_169938 [Capitella teleta]
MGYGQGKGRGRGRGSGAFSGYTCIKFLFFAFNALFWLLGCAMLGIGIWLQVAKGPYASVAPSFNFLSATALCMAAGIIVLVVGFFGCCGAIMENQCMLFTYFMLVVVIFVMEIVAGILAFVYRAEIEKVVKAELYKGVNTKYPADNSLDEEGLRTGWHAIQSHFQCCGVNNYTDWYGSHGWPNSNFVPVSCCKLRIKNCGKTGNIGTWNTGGCLEELKFWFQQNLYIVGVVGITVGVVQVLGLVAAMALFCCLRSEKYYE